MNRFLCLLMAFLLLAALLFGCGGEGECDAGDRTDAASLIGEMQAAAQWPEMQRINSGSARELRGFESISTLDYAKVDAYSLLYASDGSSYELAVIRLRDSADMPALKHSLEEHIARRAESFRYYKPDQVSRAENAVVAVHGRFAALIMCDDNAAVKAVFDKIWNE